MKFTKEQAVEKLNQVLTNGGKKPLRMSDRTLKEQVESLLTFVTDEEMEMDDFVAKVKPMLESVNSNIEHDTSAAIKTFQDNKGQQQPDKPEPVQAVGGENSELLRRLAELERKESERATQAALEKKRGDLKAYLAGKNVKNKDWVDSILGMMSIGENDDVEARGEEIVALYNKTLSGGSVVTPGAPQPGAEDKSHALDDVKAIMKRRAEMQI